MVQTFILAKWECTHRCATGSCARSRQRAVRCDVLRSEDSLLSPAEVHKAQELVYELRIGEAMTRRLLTVARETPMREIKELMRENRISGLPVVTDGELVGIVSLEDLILALERGDLDAPAHYYMTYPVHTIRQDENAIRALNVFAKMRVGRLPVVDENDNLVGIITPGDVTRGLLKALQAAYHEEEIRRYRASHLFEDLTSDHTSLLLKYDVSKGDFQRAGSASSQIKLALNRLGLDPRVVRRVAIASYEAEMNIVIHSATGGYLSAQVTSGAIVLVAHNSEPIIPDIQTAMQPGYSTAPDSVREMGFGAGMGLSNIRSCADAMDLASSSGQGTRLEVMVQLAPVRNEAENEVTADRGRTGVES